MIKDYIQNEKDERNKIDRKRAVSALNEIYPLNQSKNADVHAYLAVEHHMRI